MASPSSHHQWLALTVEDIPPEWRGTQQASLLLEPILFNNLRVQMGLPPEAVLAFEVVLELPNFPVCCEWRRWYFDVAVLPTERRLSVMITPVRQWANRMDECRSILRALLTEGKPHPVWAGSWRRVG